MFELQSASFSYGDRPVLNNVSLRLDPGSMHFLTGPSGAGKSTLMRLLYLTLRPSAGTVRVFGRDTELINRREAAEVRRRMGVVLQDCDLLDHMTVLENVALPLRIAGQKTNALAQDLRELAAWVGLGHRLDARPPELSSGERQRAAIARAESRRS